VKINRAAQAHDAQHVGDRIHEAPSFIFGILLKDGTCAVFCKFIERILRSLRARAQHALQGPKRDISFIRYDRATVFHQGFDPATITACTHSKR
jgi:hypothetical protein